MKGWNKNINEGIIVKGKMNKEEINHWLEKPFDYFRHLEGHHTVGKWSISVRTCFSQLIITVSGYNGIEFGDIYIDNGWRGKDDYYPIIKFHSAVQGWIRGARRIGNGLCASIYPKDEPITLEMLVKLTEQSWDIVKDFLNKE